jgi:hypothetical protein
VPASATPPRLVSAALAELNSSVMICAPFQNLPSRRLNEREHVVGRPVANAGDVDVGLRRPVDNGDPTGVEMQLIKSHW